MLCCCTLLLILGNLVRARVRTTRDGVEPRLSQGGLGNVKLALAMALFTNSVTVA